MNSIIVVTGLPRSGSTLMMRMLEAGGVEPYYGKEKPMEFREGGVNYLNHNRMLRETDKIKHLRHGDGSWLEECRGKVVKILTPTQIQPPRGYPYKFIYCDRKTKNIAKSQEKYAIISRKLNAPDPEMLQPAINLARKEGFKLLRSYEDSSMMIVKFEEVLKKPRVIASRVVQFLNMDLDLDKMASVVVKRNAGCLTFMLEEQIYT